MFSFLRKSRCKNCGSKMPEDAKFCPSCGTPVIQPFVQVQPVEKTDEEWKEYFRGILNRHFSQYTIQEDVPVTQLTGDTYDVFKLYKTRPNQVYKAEWGRSYDFVIYENGKVKAIIIIGDNRSYQNVKYLIAKMFAKKLQVPYIGFYKKFANEEDYVVERIKKELEA